MVTTSSLLCNLVTFCLVVNLQAPGAGFDWVSPRQTDLGGLRFQYHQKHQPHDLWPRAGGQSRLYNITSQCYRLELQHWDVPMIQISMFWGGIPRIVPLPGTSKGNCQTSDPPTQYVLSCRREVFILS